MTDLLIKIFVKDYKNIQNPTVRIRYGNFTSITGIVCNIFLCLIKIIVGLLFNSIAVIADAVNNLTDVANSAISLIGFIISGKPADKDHPYGHARYEYVACLLVSFIILILGLSLFKSSFLKILNPQPIRASIVTIIVLLLAIAVKLWMSLFYKKVGKIINSNVLFANSVDSRNDVVSTSVVLVVTVIAMYTKLNLDGIAGALVSILIIYSGISVLKDTVNDLIGTTPQPELINSIVNKLKSYEDVKGIHDLVVHSYGPGKYFSTVHVEVSSTEDILVSHDMIDNIERDFANNMGINMVIHLDPIVTDDEETNKVKQIVLNIVKELNKDFTIHDFRMVKGETHTNLIFDILVPADYRCKNSELITDIGVKLNEYNPKYNAVITVDRNYV